MQNLRKPKFVIKTIVSGIFLISIIVNSPFLYQQVKSLGTELYRFTQGSRK